MNWKICTTAFISLLSTAMPQNIIGCGPEADPYDYYTSFFYQNLPDAKAYRPFYYTGYNFLYDEAEPVETSDVLANEWAAYCGAPVTGNDAKDFVNSFGLKDVNSLYYNIEKSQPLNIADSVKRNSMTNYFLQQKDLEALGYIIYAKKVQPYVTGESTGWKPVSRDNTAMDKLIKNGQQLYAVAKKDLFKLKYGYQVLRLAHYSKRYDDVIKWYDEYIAGNKTTSVLQPLSLALKAGALYHSGRQAEAAYLFSKAFSDNDVKKVSNYISFNWSVDSREDREKYISLCKNDNEKAAMLALFALGSVGDEVQAMKEIYRLDPHNNALEVLAVREINKLEETYFTPELNKQNGGKRFYYTWNDGNNDSLALAGNQHVKALAGFLHVAAQKNNTANPGLFETGAAYASLMIRDYNTTKKYLADAKKMKLTAKVKDQWALTNLLLTINAKDKIDAAFEAQILPSIKWLQHKAQTKKAVKSGYADAEQWKIFYRNLMSEILAKRYHQQGDMYKEVLVVGAADRIFNKASNGYYSNAVDFLHTNLESKDVEKLYALMNSKIKTNYENYLVGFNSLRIDDVADFAGTAYLRDYNYSSAIKWLKKNTAVKKYSIDTNPFIDLLYDQEEAFPDEIKRTSKIAFAVEMLRLEILTKTDQISIARNYYKMALGLYNITYYGHAWKLVEYSRGGTDGYYIPSGANAFQKEYYGCFKAHDYFNKAMNLSKDKNFKARCLFMMAKCVQKQIRQQQYNDFGNNYWYLFKNNKYFPQLIKEYGQTAFYKEAFSSCSYLRDFVQKK